MSDTVVSSQEDSKRNREGSKSEERKEEKKDTRKKKKTTIEEKPAKKAESHVAAFMYSKNQSIEEEVYHAFRSEVSLVLYEKMAQLITFALMKGIPIKDIIVKG